MGRNLTVKVVLELLIVETVSKDINVMHKAHIMYGATYFFRIKTLEPHVLSQKTCGSFKKRVVPLKNVWFL